MTLSTTECAIPKEYKNNTKEHLKVLYNTV